MTSLDSLDRCVVFVDDDTFLLGAMERELRLFLLGYGYRFYICDSVASYLQLDDSIVGCCDLAIIDLWMIDKSSNRPDREAGLEVIQNLRSRQPDCYVMIYTAHLNENARPALDRMDQIAIVEKPAATTEITDLISEVLQLEERSS